MEDLNRRLWTYRDDAFLPHGAAADGHAERQPIYLTTGDETPNTPQMLFLVDQATTTPDEVGEFKRAALIFDGGDGAALQAARKLWKTATTADTPAVYYAETDRGWTKKAEHKPA